MTCYSTLERTFARYLDSMPGARSLAKSCYQRANYLIFRERAFCIAMHRDARIMLPEESPGRPASDEHCFFGYYDKSPWSPDMRYVLAHALQKDGTVAIRMYDLQTRKAHTLGFSVAWNYQQGSMLQWLPGSPEPQVIWNDVVDGNLGMRLVSIFSGSTRWIPWPIQTVHPNGREALTLNYRRLHRIRAEYGYPMQVRNFNPDQPLWRDGIWHIDLQTGEGRLTLSLEELRALQPRRDMADAQHKVNHLIYSPRGNRVAFMHRWIGRPG